PGGPCGAGRGPADQCGATRRAALLAGADGQPEQYRRNAAASASGAGAGAPTGAGGGVMRVAILQHVAFEGPAQIGLWLDERGLQARVYQLYAGDALPALDDFDLLLVLGGPMSVHDEAEYPWLAAEKHLLRAALAAGKRALGICLGGQLLAEALGAGVRVAEQAEIGWHLIEQHPDARRSPVGRMLP